MIKVPLQPAEGSLAGRGRGLLPGVCGMSGLWPGINTDLELFESSWNQPVGSPSQGVSSQLVLLVWAMVLWTSRLPPPPLSTKSCSHLPDETRQLHHHHHHHTPLQGKQRELESKFHFPFDDTYCRISRGMKIRRGLWISVELNDNPHHLP